MNEKLLTHRQLVGLAHRYLHSLGYPCILTEPGYRKELPDAIGFKDDDSLLIECKASRADFLKDKKKEFRAEGKGVGMYRLYLTNAGIVFPWDVPPKWQLAWAMDENTIKFMKPWVAQPRIFLNPYKDLAFMERDYRDELGLLYSWCYRKNNNFLPPVPKTGVRLSLDQMAAPKWVWKDFEEDGFCGFCKHRNSPVAACNECYKEEFPLYGVPWLGTFRTGVYHRGNEPQVKGCQCPGYEINFEYLFSKERWKEEPVNESV